MGRVLGVIVDSHEVAAARRASKTAAWRQCRRNASWARSPPCARFMVMAMAIPKTLRSWRRTERVAGPLVAGRHPGDERLVGRLLVVAPRAAATLTARCSRRSPRRSTMALSRSRCSPGTLQEETQENIEGEAAVPEYGDGEGHGGQGDVELVAPARRP